MDKLIMSLIIAFLVTPSCAVRCYVCERGEDCDTLTSVPVEENCNGCMMTTTRIRDVRAFDRGCVPPVVPSCTPLNTSNGVHTVTTECCFSDLCNNKTSMVTPTPAIRCYVCNDDSRTNNCASLKSVNMEENCGSCTTTTTAGRGVRMTNRNCLPPMVLCTPFKSSEGNVSVTTDCCFSDLCNNVKDGEQTSSAGTIDVKFFVYSLLSSFVLFYVNYRG